MHKPALSIAFFQALNAQRAKKWHKGTEWSLSDWGVALAGEIGEACDVIKKLNRLRDGIQRNDKTKADYMKELAAELADAFSYLVLLADAAGIQLDEAAIEKFNAVSDRYGFEEKL